MKSITTLAAVIALMGSVFAADAATADTAKNTCPKGKNKTECTAKAKGAKEGMPTPAELLAKFDEDKDGKLNEAEFTKLMTAQRKHMAKMQKRMGNQEGPMNEEGRPQARRGKRGAAPEGAEMGPEGRPEMGPEGAEMGPEGRPEMGPEGAEMDSANAPKGKRGRRGGKRGAAPAPEADAE